ncbi:hypothetical protein FM103_08645 [Corynebacterium xerosis]|nr:hypothetical protein FM103_08645 [Corynebacterium xerosis]
MPHGPIRSDRLRGMSVLSLFFIALVVLVGLGTLAFAVLVLTRLFNR